MTALLIMIGTGYCITKRGMLDEHTNNQMSALIVNVFNPFLVFSSAADSVGLISINTMKIVGLIAIGMFVFFIIAGMVLSPFFDQDFEQRKLFQMMFVFSNLGFIGIPVVTNILGSEYVVYVTEFVLVYTIVFYTYGIMLADGKLSLSSFKSMINPGMLSGAAALLVVIFNLQIPDFIKTAVTYLGNVTSPMALIAVGFSLAHSDIKKIFGELRLYIFAVIKLLLIPLFALPILRRILDDVTLLSVCMIMFGMPVGNMPLILANQKGVEGSTCSSAIIVTTIFCVVTIPILITAARLI